LQRFIFPTQARVQLGGTPCPCQTTLPLTCEERVGEASAKSTSPPVPVVREEKGQTSLARKAVVAGAARMVRTTSACSTKGDSSTMAGVMSARCAGCGIQAVEGQVFKKESFPLRKARTFCPNCQARFRRQVFQFVLAFNLVLGLLEATSGRQLALRNAPN